MAQLEGKVAIVTGASSGIGEATAIALAAAGANVTIAARRSDRLASVVDRIAQETGSDRSSVLSVTADMADEAQVNEVVQKTYAEFGRVDILVNNAGVMLLGMIDGANTEDWRRMININRPVGK